MQEVLDFESRKGGADRAPTKNAQGHCGDRVKVMGKGGAVCVRLTQAATHRLTDLVQSLFISLGFKFHVERVGLVSRGRTGTGAGIGQSLEPERVLSVHRDVLPLTPSPLESVDVSLQLLG